MSGQRDDPRRRSERSRPPTVANTVVNGATSVAGPQPALGGTSGAWRSGRWNRHGDRGGGKSHDADQCRLLRASYGRRDDVGAVRRRRAACRTATAWVTPITGMVDWAGGPRRRQGIPAPPHPPSVGTAVVFIDAVTGNSSPQKSSAAWVRSDQLTERGSAGTSGRSYIERHLRDRTCERTG